MAFEKEHEYKGFTANYWMIDAIELSKSYNKTTTVLKLYKDKAERDKDIFSFIRSVYITIPEYLLDVKSVYEKVKLMGIEDLGNFFSDAKDV